MKLWIQMLSLAILFTGCYLIPGGDAETVTIAPDGRKAVYCNYDFRGPARCLKRLATECPHGYEVLHESVVDKFSACLAVGGGKDPRE